VKGLLKTAAGTLISVFHRVLLEQFFQPLLMLVLIFHSFSALRGIEV